MRLFPAPVLRLAFALCLSLCLGLQASAKVVGIVFDDSGSMDGQIQLPAFGVQLLLSSLDGRDGKDRVFTVQMSKLISAYRLSYVQNGPNPLGNINADTVAAWADSVTPRAYQQQEMTTHAQQQKAINSIARDWPKPAGGTPYEVVELMLHTITSELKPEEDGYLVILTDGEFSILPDLASVERSYRSYKARLDAKKALLRVEFLGIGLKDKGLSEEIERQGVRRLLLSIFNGDAASGVHDVRNAADMVSNLKDIIASVAATDRSQSSNYIRFSGSTATIDSPLSVSRITSVATAPKALAGKPAGLVNLLTPPPTPQDQARYRSEMLKEDTGTPPLEAETTQLRYQPGLPPGQYRLQFDKAVGDAVFLLFETNAFAQAEIRNLDGTLAPKNAAGAFLLGQGLDYRLELVLMDQTATGTGAVLLASLKGNPLFSGQVTGPSASSNVQMSVAGQSDRAVGTFSAGAIGNFTARGQIRLDGFVSPPSRPIDFIVVDPTVTFQTRVTPVDPCSACKSDEIATLFSLEVSDRDVAQIVIEAPGAFHGRGKLDLSKLPAWLYVTDAGGGKLNNDAAFAIDAGKPLTLLLRRKGNLAELNRDQLVIDIGVSADPPLKGSARIARIIKPVIPVAELVHTGSALGGPDVTPELTGKELLAGSVPLDFLLKEALAKPVAIDFSVENPDWAGAMLISARIDVRDYTVHVTPATRWYCACFLFLPAEVQDLTLVYNPKNGWQNARSLVHVRLVPSIREMVLGCLQLLLVLLAILWLIGWTVAWARARRFPLRAIVEITEGRDLPRHYNLRHWNWTPLKAVLWLPFGIPHEVRRIEGMWLRAERGGARLLLAKSPGDTIIGSLGQSIHDILELNPRHPDVKIVWNDELERPGRPRQIVRLKKSMGEAA